MRLVWRTGLQGLLNYFAARGEVRRALKNGVLNENRIGHLRTLPANGLPSFSTEGKIDRKLADIDQDGYLFASNPVDIPFFNSRIARVPRGRDRVSIVLKDGKIQFKKQFSHVSDLPGIWKKTQGLLGVGFYNEAAALIRLREKGFVPRILSVNPTDLSIHCEYIPSKTLYEHFMESTVTREDKDEPSIFKSNASTEHRMRIRDNVLEMVACGLMPIGASLRNILVEKSEGSLYWVDFELAALTSQPRWNDRLEEGFQHLKHLFDVNFITRDDIRSFQAQNEIYSPADLGYLGQIGDVSQVGSGEGRWGWLLRNQADWRNLKILDLGSNNCLYGIRQLQEGAAEVHCVERNPESLRQASILLSANEQNLGRRLNLKPHLSEMVAFLESQNFPVEYFDITTALCSIYYLEPEPLERSLKIIHRISKECWLQANMTTPREDPALALRARVDYLTTKLKESGFHYVQVISPKGYSRPLLIGKKF